MAKLLGMSRMGWYQFESGKTSRLSPKNESRLREVLAGPPPWTSRDLLTALEGPEATLEGIIDMMAKARASGMDHLLTDIADLAGEVRTLQTRIRIANDTWDRLTSELYPGLTVSEIVSSSNETAT